MKRNWRYGRLGIAICVALILAIFVRIALIHVSQLAEKMLEREEYIWGILLKSDRTVYAASYYYEDLSDEDIKILEKLLEHEKFGISALGMLEKHEHAKIFPSVLESLNKPVHHQVRTELPELIIREGNKDYVNKSIARKQLRKIIFNSNDNKSIDNHIMALGVVGNKKDIEFLKSVSGKKSVSERAARLACAKLGDRCSLRVTAELLARNSVIPVNNWDQEKGCVACDTRYEADCEGAQYIDHEDLYQYLGQYLRKLNPESLYLGYMYISDYSFLKGLNIKYLCLSTPKSFSLEFARGMPLELLDISFTKVVDISPLTGSPLKILNLASCKNIKSFEPLSGLKLRNLNLYGTSVTDLSILNGMPLEIVQLGHTEVSDLSSLKGAPLKQLWISDSLKVNDISPLKGAPLELLSAGRTNISDLKPISECPLKHLSIYGTKVTDLRPIKHMQLESLVVSKENIEFGLEKINIKNFKDIP